MPCYHSQIRESENCDRDHEQDRIAEATLCAFMRTLAAYQETERFLSLIDWKTAGVTIEQFNAWHLRHLWRDSRHG